MMEVTTQFCNILRDKHSMPCDLIRVVPKEVKGTGDNTKFSGHFQLSPHELCSWDSDSCTISSSTADRLCHAVSNVLQRLFSTRGYSFYIDIPYGIAALQFDFPPANCPAWFVAGILLATPSQITPSTFHRQPRQPSFGRPGVVGGPRWHHPSGCPQTVRYPFQTCAWFWPCHLLLDSQR